MANGVGVELASGNSAPPWQNGLVICEGKFGSRIGVVDEEVDEQGIEERGIRAKKKRPVSRPLPVYELSG